MRLALLLAIALGAAAVETRPVEVLTVVDGCTIEVAGDLGGVPSPVRVRLQWIGTAESKDNRHGEAKAEGKAAAEALAQMLPAGSRVVLWGPGEKLAADGYGRVLAVVYGCINVHRDHGLLVPDRMSASVQEYLVLWGHSVYWRKHGDAPEPLHAALLKAQADAEAAKAGVWATDPQWMRDKAHARAAPRRER